MIRIGWQGAAGFAGIGLVAASTLLAQDRGATAPSPAPSAGAPTTAFEALDAEHAQRSRDRRTRARTAVTQADQQSIAMEGADTDREFSRRFLDLARTEPKSPDTVFALRAAINLGKHGEAAEAAIEQLRRDWAADPGVAIACLSVGRSPNRNGEPLLREVIAKNPAREARGLAMLALAMDREGLSKLPKTRKQDQRVIERLRRNYGQEWLDTQTDEVCEGYAEEAARLYEAILKDYADVKFIPELPNVTRTIGEVAGIYLGGLRLLPGSAAPNVEGTTLDGSPFRLRDHRGKVVVLVFWASWCPPCLEQVPSEKAMVARFPPESFALIGVNCDDTAEKGREAARKEGMTWTNLADGKGDPGAIQGDYKVTGIPATFVLDRDGTIRHKGLRGEPLADAVANLLGEPGGKAPK